MSSIQDRLRSHMGKAEIQDVLPDCREAADTIDALVFALTELYQSFEFCVGKDTPVAVEAKRALDLVGGGKQS